MENIILHEYRIPTVGIKRKIIYHISDLHLNEYDEYSDSREIENAKKMTAEWECLRENFSLKHNEPYGDIQKQSPKTHFKNLINYAKDGDALILTGDMLDSISGANIRLSDRLLKDFPHPLFAVCGNHDNGNTTASDSVFANINKPIRIAEFDDIILVGINNSNRIITKEQCDAVIKVFNMNKPVIIAMHIPFMTDDTHDIFMGIGDGFRINYDGCPAENLEMLTIIKDNADKCIAVLAGHLHFSVSGKIASGVPQFIASQAITGHINKYIIG